MSLLLTVITAVISLFSVISHSDSGHINLSVESHLYIVPVLRGVIIIDVWWNIILFGLNFHGRFHLCSMYGDVGTIVVVLPVITHLILMIVIRPPLVWICIVGSVRGLARGWGVCLGILRLSTPVVLSLILLTFMHSDEYMCDAGLGVISLVNHHGLVLWMQAIEEGILGMVLQVPQSEHVVVKLLALDS